MRRGFTLIEMMVVLAIICILALLAYPTYQDKFVRDQINEALPLADLAKAPVAASWMLLKTLPPDTKFAIIDVNAAGLKGKVLTLRPAVVEDAQIVPVAWVCASASVPGNMVARGVNRTTIPSPYLPGKCR